MSVFELTENSVNLLFTRESITETDKEYILNRISLRVTCIDSRFSLESIGDLVTVAGNYREHNAARILHLDNSSDSYKQFVVSLSSAKNISITTTKILDDSSSVNSNDNTACEPHSALCRSLGVTSATLVTVKGTDFSDAQPIESFLADITLKLVLPDRPPQLENRVGWSNSEILLNATVHLVNSCQTRVTLEHIVLCRLKPQWSRFQPSSNSPTEQSSTTSPQEPTKSHHRRGLFINGWNAWSFCGAVQQIESVPLPALPHAFSRAFHDGSLALQINEYGARNSKTGLEAVVGFASSLFELPWQRPAEDAVGRGVVLDPKLDRRASDMYTLLFDQADASDGLGGWGLLMGFLSQREQFGCISTDDDHAVLSAHVSCDDVVLCPGASSDSGASVIEGGTVDGRYTVTGLHTDWLYIQPQPYLHLPSPLDRYFTVSGWYNRVTLDKPVVWPVNKHPHSISLEEQSKVDGYSDDDDKSINTLTDDSDDMIDEEEREEESTVVEMGRPPAGWCSWYHYFEHITGEKLHSNLALLSEARITHGLRWPAQGFDLFQVDDGHAKAWGDWLSTDAVKLPGVSALTLLSSEIRAAGMQPGLWLAPFAADKHSTLAQTHPEWVLRRPANGVASQWLFDWPANSGNCGKWFLALDVTHPGVQEQVRSVIRTVVHDWGYRYLKLDFLYAACVRSRGGPGGSGRHDQSLTRAQALHMAMRLVRDACRDGDVGNVWARGDPEEVYLLGCGAPLGSVIGLVHANRVSADAGLSWHPSFPLPAGDQWNLPSARNMVRNTVTRMAMHGRWWVNDPDCLLLRPNSGLTGPEVRGLATVKAMSGGSLLLSDDMSLVCATSAAESRTESRLALLRALLPPLCHSLCPTARSAVPLDLLDRRMPQLLRLRLRMRYQATEWRKSTGYGASSRISSRSRSGGRVDRWTLLAACNWADEGSDSWGSVLTSGLSWLGSRPTPGLTHRVPLAKLGLPPLTQPCLSLLHVYEFWSESYRCEIVQFDATSAEHKHETSLSSLGLVENSQHLALWNPSLPQATDTSPSAPLNMPKTNHCLSLGPVETHSACLYALRLQPFQFLSLQTKQSGRSTPAALSLSPQYLGSNMHFTCGQELKNVRHSDTEGDEDLYELWLREWAWRGTGEHLTVFLPIDTFLELEESSSSTSDNFGTRNEYADSVMSDNVSFDFDRIVRADSHHSVELVTTVTLPTDPSQKRTNGYDERYTLTQSQLHHTTAGTIVGVVVRVNLNVAETGADQGAGLRAGSEADVSLYWKRKQQ